MKQDIKYFNLIIGSAGRRIETWYDTNTYHAKYGHFKASCTAGRMQAAMRLTDKMISNGFFNDIIAFHREGLSLEPIE